jgi:hypothetical protein
MIIRCISVVLGIFSSTVKNNILFGKEYNHKLFQRVINATALATVSQVLKKARSPFDTIFFIYHRILFNCLVARILLLVIKV